MTPSTRWQRERSRLPTAISPKPLERSIQVPLRHRHRAHHSMWHCPPVPPHHLQDFALSDLLPCCCAQERWAQVQLLFLSHPYSVGCEGTTCNTTEISRFRSRKLRAYLRKSLLKSSLLEIPSMTLSGKSALLCIGRGNRASCHLVGKHER